METSKINLVVFDEANNFEKSKELLGYEGATLKRLFCIQSLSQLKRFIDSDLKDDDLVFLVIHVFGKTDNLKGIVKFKNSGILEAYPNLEYMFISEGNKQNDIKKLMIDNKIDVQNVFKYHEVLTELREERFSAILKRDLNNNKGNTDLIMKPQVAKGIEQCDYAIISALEEDEMAKILPVITRSGRVENQKHLIEHGFITSNPEKKVAYASQQATGMIDAAILATELINLFQPKVLIMIGVLGGKPEDVQIGDVVVATKTFTVDKGKLNELGFKKELETSNTESSYLTSIRRAKGDIIDYLRKEDVSRESKIDVHFGPIGCVRHVIDLEGFFEQKLSSVDRKAIALEMESYAISRACELVNDGKTNALIIKSAMDNTVDKVDNAKPYAAWTSANFVKYILEKDVI